MTKITTAEWDALRSDPRYNASGTFAVMNLRVLASEVLGPDRSWDVLRDTGRLVNQGHRPSNAVRLCLRLAAGK